MVVLTPELNKLMNNMLGDLRKVLNHYGEDLVNQIKNKILVVELADRQEGEEGFMITRRQHKIIKRRKRWNDNHSRPQPEKKINAVVKEDKNVSKPVEPTVNDGLIIDKDYYFESVKTNEKVNNTLKVDRTISQNLESYLETQKKLNKSKKNVMDVINRLRQKDKYLKTIKDEGFILSYAAVIKISINNPLLDHDIIENKNNIINPEFSSEFIEPVKLNVVSSIRKEDKNNFPKTLESVDKTKPVSSDKGDLADSSIIVNKQLSIKPSSVLKGVNRAAGFVTINPNKPADDLSSENNDDKKKKKKYTGISININDSNVITIKPEVASDELSSQSNKVPNTINLHNTVTRFPVYDNQFIGKGGDNLGHEFIQNNDDGESEGEMDYYHDNDEDDSDNDYY